MTEWRNNGDEGAAVDLLLDEDAEALSAMGLTHVAEILVAAVRTSDRGARGRQLQAAIDAGAGNAAALAILTVWCRILGEVEGVR